jgi:hypothetical protein
MAEATVIVSVVAVELQVRRSAACVRSTALHVRSKGGRGRSVYRLGDLREFTAPKTAADLRDLLAESIIEVRSGRLDPKIANALGYLGASYLRAVEVSDVQVRLSALESRQRVEERAFLQSSPADSEYQGEKYIAMASIRSRLVRLEDKRRFLDWFIRNRWLYTLTADELETFAGGGNLPETLLNRPSKLDKLDRKSLIKRWKEAD